MEPSELDHHHHHHHQQRREHLRGFAAAAAPPATPSTPPHHVGLSNHAWKYSSLLLKDEDSTTPISGGGADHLGSPPIDPKEGYEALLPPPPLGSTSMVHDQLGLQYYWPCTSTTADTFQLGQLACRAAEEFPDSFLKLAGAARFGAAVWNPAAAGEHYQFPSTGKYVLPSPDADEDVGHPSHTSDADHRYFQLPTSTSSSCAFGGGAAATAFERVGSYTKLLLAAAPNSTTPSPSSSLPGSFSTQELQALELLASARLGAQQMALRQPSLIGNMAFFGEGVACGSTTGFLPAAPSRGETSNEPQIKISSLLDGVKEGKRANGGRPGQYKASPAPVAKKARPAAAEPRSSTSPLKVRKEKLGDRVAALQQLVAPFGKTDTASVLTEAVGYIKFLQEQVQTLSMPYLRYSNKKKIRTAQGINPNNEEKDETKQDLRSRGLCLVPLSYTSYFTSESTGSSTAWSPSYFRGA